MHASLLIEPLVRVNIPTWSYVVTKGLEGIPELEIRS